MLLPICLHLQGAEIVHRFFAWYIVQLPSLMLRTWVHLLWECGLIHIFLWNGTFLSAIFGLAKTSRRIGQLYDDLRRADFQGDKDAVASWTEEVLGLQRFSKKGTVFNDETRRGVQTYDVSCSFFLFFQFELWEFLIFEVWTSKGLMDWEVICSCWNLENFAVTRETLSATLRRFATCQGRMHAY